MSKSTNSTVLLRVILLTAVVATSIIGAVVFFSGPVAAGESHSPNQQEMIHAKAESPTVDKLPAITEPDYLGGSSSGPSFDWCYVTVANGDEIPQIHPRNTIKVNAELCEQIGLLIVGYYWQEAMK